MTLSEAANRLYDYYDKRGFVGVNTWLQSIGEYGVEDDEKIIIFVRHKNYDYRQCRRELLKEGTQREFIWNGFAVEFKYIGVIKIG